MKKRVVIPSIASLLLLVGIVSAAGNQSDTQYQTQPQSSPTSTSQKTTQETKTNASPLAEREAEKPKPACNGTTIKSDCTADGVNYAKYIYHPAVAEKSHTETITTYEEKVSSYCTLCNDGTYSPTCATGRGACSHHGGVAQWNAPRYSSVPVYTTKKVIDSPAIEARYEKVAH